MASVITLLGTYLLNRNEKYENRKSEIRDKLIAGVYSPLNFCVLQIIENIASTTGNFIDFMQSKTEELEESKSHLIDKLREENCPSFCSNSFREILSPHLGFIKDPEFRNELSRYYLLLNIYENQVSRFVSEGFRNDNIEKERNWIGNMIDASLEIVSISATFLSTFSKSMDSDGKQAETLFEIAPLTKFSDSELNKLTAKINSR